MKNVGLCLFLTQYFILNLDLKSNQMNIIFAADSFLSAVFLPRFGFTITIQSLGLVWLILAKSYYEPKHGPCEQTRQVNKKLNF